MSVRTVEVINGGQRPVNVFNVLAVKKKAEIKPSFIPSVPTKQDLSALEVRPFFISKVSLLPTFVEGRVSEIISQNRPLFEARDLEASSKADLSLLIGNIRGLLSAVVSKDIDALQGIAALLQSLPSTVPLWFELLQRITHSRLASASGSAVITGQDQDANARVGQAAPLSYHD
jgi:hypothetical protein